MSSDTSNKVDKNVITQKGNCADLRISKDYFIGQNFQCKCYNYYNNKYAQCPISTEAKVPKIYCVLCRIMSKDRLKLDRFSRYGRLPISNAKYIPRSTYGCFVVEVVVVVRL